MVFQSTTNKLSGKESSFVSFTFHKIQNRALLRPSNEKLEDKETVDRISWSGLAGKWKGVARALEGRKMYPAPTALQAEELIKSCDGVRCSAQSLAPGV